MFWFWMIFTFLLGLAIGTFIGICRGGDFVRKKYNLPSAYEEWQKERELK